MPSKQLNVRVSEETRKYLTMLMKKTGMSAGAVVAMALYQMIQSEFPLRKVKGMESDDAN